MALPGNTATGSISFTTIVNAIVNLTQVLSKLQQTITGSFVSLSTANVFSVVQTFTKPPIINAGSLGTGTILPEGVISAQTSAAGIGNGADTTEDTLFTYSLVANSLDAVNRGLAFVAFGTIANNADTKTIRVRFGGTAVYSLTAPTNVAVSWVVRGRIYKTAASTQICEFQGQAGATIGNPTVTATAITDTGSIAILVSGQAGTGNASDILANGMVVEYQN